MRSSNIITKVVSLLALVVIVVLSYSPAFALVELKLTNGYYTEDTTYPESYGNTTGLSHRYLSTIYNIITNKIIKHITQVDNSVTVFDGTVEYFTNVSPAEVMAGNREHIDKGYQIYDEITATKAETKFTLKHDCIGENYINMLHVSLEVVISPSSVTEFIDPCGVSFCENRTITPVDPKNILLNGISPTSYNPDQYEANMMFWDIPVKLHCGDTVTITPTLASGIAYAKIGDVYSHFTGEYVSPKTKDKGPCEDPCGCNQTITNSQANLRSGNYFHSQNMITKPESLAFGLSYNSLENFDIPLGRGWNHNYNIGILESSGKISISLGEGDVLNFVYSGGIYLPASTSKDTSSIVKNADGTYTRTFINGLIQTFNNAGRLTAITDPNGKKTTLTYAGSDLAMITDSSARKLTIVSSGGRITSISDPAGRITTFTYTGNLLTSVNGPAGNSWQYTYDAIGFLIRKTDPAGNSSSNVYDISGKNTVSTDPLGRTKSISYDSSTSSTITEKDGSTWNRTYDPIINAPTATVDQLGNTANKTFDSKGNILTNTTAAGNTTRYTYDAANNMTSVTDPLGHTTSYTYNSLGKVLTTTDPNGHVTTNSYDAKGNLLQTIDPKGGKTVFTYDTKGNLLTVTDPLAKKVTYAYDTYNNLITITDQNKGITTRTYDAVGNLLTEKNPVGGTTTYTYDQLNRPVKITDPLGYITQFTYDNLGNRTATTDANGKITTSVYNYKNQPVRTQDAMGATTTYTYGSTSCANCSGGGADKLTSVTDASGNVTGYAYDQVSRLTQETDPGGHITSYSYNPDGTLASRTDGNGHTTTYSYDAAGHLLSRTYADGRSDTFTYDPAGNMLTARNGNISYTLTWDAANKLTGITDSLGRTISYTLDADGNRTKMAAPDARVTTYVYDVKNRLTSLVNNGSNYSFTNDALDRRTKLTSPNGTNTAYTYDADSRVTALATKTSKNKAITSVSHAYDKTANRLTRVEPTGTTNYSYDTIYRLIKNALGTITKEQFTYDTTGNRTTGPTIATAYTIDQGNQLKAKTGTSYTYDNNGNQINKVESTTTWHYSYDGDNRLEKVEKSAGTTTNTTTFKYDPFGNRIEKTVDGVTTKYLYDGSNILYEYDATNAITARYTHNLAIDDPLGFEKGGKLYAYHKDTLGSITAITDSTQAVVNSYSYDSFGNMTQTGTLAQPYAYTAREWDKETGLYYYRARAYDSMVGRFLQKDPIGFKGGINLYNYVQNNPINFTDPTGLYWFRQSWQEPGVVGRRDTPVPPRGLVSEFIEKYVPAGYTFGETHDGFVDAATGAGVPDIIANIPSMIPMLGVAIGAEVLRTLGILDQPKPTRQPTPCK